jgi:hypothetical protein
VPPQRRRRRLKPVIISAAIAAGALLVGTGAYVLLSTGGGTDGPTTPAAVKADQIFGLDPQGRLEGRTHALTSVASTGSTIVASGFELGDGNDRGQFILSADGGRSWELARVQAADGDEPPAGEFPRQVAGTDGAWVAIGGTDTSAAVWTSNDARTWTRQADSAASAFGPVDRVTSMTRTGSGFVAVGESSPSGSSRDSQGVLWSSPDGRSWQRFTADQLSMAGVIRLDQVAANGDTVVLRGTTKKDSGFWRSTDGGRTWSTVKVPQGQGSYGSTASVAAGPGGFFVAREAKRKSGKKTIGYAVIFNSTDGATWQPVSQVRPADYARLDRIGGSATGLAVLAVTQKGDTAVLRSTDGKTWQRAATISGGKDKALTGVAAYSTGIVVTGRNGPAGYLATIGVPHGVVDLTRIADFIHPGRTITALAQGAGQTVAVGSTNGDAAAWVTRDGKAWTRAQAVGVAFKGSGVQRLTDVAAGDKGWVAVGQTDGDSSGALVVTSADGTSWRKAHDRFDGVPLGVAYGPAGYVAVGQHDPSKGDSTAVAWYSTDLQGWNRGGGAGASDLGEGKWMSDVAATTTGYVAVGGQTKGNVSQPVVWTSIDGKRWAALPTSPPLPPGATAGSFTQVVARGTTVVALGSADMAGSTSHFAAVSADEGKTWQPQVLESTGLTSVTTTPKGFVVTGTIGASGHSDVVLWASADGRTWRQVRPHGFGLDGRGAQQLNAATVIGGDLLAVGVTGDHHSDSPTLWQAPLP